MGFEGSTQQLFSKAIGADTIQRCTSEIKLLEEQVHDVLDFLEHGEGAALLLIMWEQ
jgi:hypothetical protein